MGTKLHTVIGATGASGMALLTELKSRDFSVRAVARKPVSAEGFEAVSADMMLPEEAALAIRGSSFVYLCLGLPYDSTVWAKQWPLVMQHTIDTCSREGAVLVFLDNIYMYGPPPMSVPFDEQHPQHPVTRKGKARKQTVEMLQQAMQSGSCEAVIARSADFYGPGTTNSLLYVSFLERMLQGKDPQILTRPDVPHTYANTMDNARAMVDLALDSSTHGQVWHLPVGHAVTYDELLALFNAELDSRFKLKKVPDFMRRPLALFIPALGELNEMLYQFEDPYVMSFDKFRQHFPEFEVTPYEAGIKDMVESFKKKPERVKTPIKEGAG